MNRSLIFTLTLCILLSAIVGGCSQDEAVIKGPGTSPVGMQVMFSVSQKADWTVDPEDGTLFTVDTNGKRLTFASPYKQKYVIYAAIRACDRQSGTRILKREFYNGLEPDKPVPPDGHDDGGNITPPNPVTHYEVIGKYALQKAEELVRSQFFDQELTAIAMSYRDVAALVRAGEIESPETARVVLRSETRKSLMAISETSLDAWRIWSESVAKKIESCNIGNVDEVEKLYAAIAESMSRERNEMQLMDNPQVPVVSLPSRADHDACLHGNCPIPQKPQTTIYRRRWR